LSTKEIIEVIEQGHMSCVRHPHGSKFTNKALRIEKSRSMFLAKAVNNGKLQGFVL